MDNSQASQNSADADTVDYEGGKLDSLWKQSLSSSNALQELLS